MLTEQHNIEHPYHHGNVKEALIDAAMSLIASKSTELISLRKQLEAKSQQNEDLEAEIKSSNTEIR